MQQSPGVVDLRQVVCADGCQRAKSVLSGRIAASRIGFARPFAFIAGSTTGFWIVVRLNQRGERVDVLSLAACLHS